MIVICVGNLCWSSVLVVVFVGRGGGFCAGLSSVCYTDRVNASVVGVLPLWYAFYTCA